MTCISYKKEKKKKKRTEALTSHGATCPDTLRMSFLLLVKEDQWLIQKCDIKYTL